MQFVLLFSIRCTAQNNNLDGGGGCRSHELSEALTAVLDPRTLSEEYGIVSNILVRVYIPSSPFDLAYYQLKALHYKLSPCRHPQTYRPRSTSSTY